MLKLIRYSKNFDHLISDKARVSKLLNGCCFYSSSFELWGHSRRFIASAIDKDGTILDIGCANGFLLRCLQEWSGHLLTPYGVDINEDFINSAKWLFPEHKDHFIKFDLRELPETSSFTLPRSYDFVYWTIWDDWTFKSSLEIRVIRSVEAMVRSGGKLMLGLYHEDRSRSFAVLRELEGLGFSFSKVVENFDGCEVLAWQAVSTTESAPQHGNNT